jgi:hypothetical protein
MFKKEKLYKIVYKTSYYSDDAKTLIVVGRDPVHAMKKFYEIVGTSVRDILEFTEIKLKNEGGENYGK